MWNMTFKIICMRLSKRQHIPTPSTIYPIAMSINVGCDNSPLMVTQHWHMSKSKHCSSTKKTYMHNWVWKQQIKHYILWAPKHIAINIIPMILAQGLSHLVKMRSCPSYVTKFLLDKWHMKAMIMKFGKKSVIGIDVKPWLWFSRWSCQLTERPIIM